ncbi:hypothetical protein ES703_49376 [subsurface metagenome]
MVLVRGGEGARGRVVPALLEGAGYFKGHRVGQVVHRRQNERGPQRTGQTRRLRREGQGCLHLGRGGRCRGEVHLWGTPRGGEQARQCPRGPGSRGGGSGRPATAHDPGDHRQPLRGAEGWCHRDAYFHGARLPCHRHKARELRGQGSHHRRRDPQAGEGDQDKGGS